jgi:hypothetical protein
MFLTTNNTEKDIIPPLSLEYDCCVPEFEGKTVKLNDIQLDLSTKNIVNRLEDLKLASHKIEEVDRLIAEQEWKLKQSKYDYHLSFLSYIGMVITGISMMFFCYCCCLHYSNCSGLCYNAKKKLCGKFKY